MPAAPVWLLVLGTGRARAAPLPCPVAAAQLPRSVPLRTATEGFNARWELALRDNTLCLRSRAGPGPWRALDARARPDALLGGATMVAMSVDGTHLQVELSDGRLLRATDLRRRDSPRSLRWTDSWGWPAGRGPGLSAPPGARRFAVSDSHPFQVGHTTDVAGQRHPVGLGVAHQYRLSDNGQVLYLNDWWLPADWSRRVCLPPGVQAVDMSASGSTVALRGATGRLFTRLYDVDNGGENDLLTFTWSLSGGRGPSRAVRALPAASWVEHALPAGDVGGRISLHQDGPGDAARVLRVEVDGGVYEKRIHDPVWRHVPVPGHRAQPPPPIPPQTPSPDTPLTGTLRREGVPGTLELRAQEHDLGCSPTKLGVLRDGRPVLTPTGPLTIALHLVPGFVTHTRPEDWRAQGGLEPVRGAVLLPASLDGVDDAVVTGILGRPGADWIPVLGDAGALQVSVAEMTARHRFGVRRSEKGRHGSRLLVDLSVPAPADPGPHPAPADPHPAPGSGR